MSITAKAMDIIVPIRMASHLLFLIFFSIGSLLMDVTSFPLLFYHVLINCQGDFIMISSSLFLHPYFTLFYSFLPIMSKLRFIYLHALFLIVNAAYGNSQVYTKVVRTVKIGRYSHSGSPGLRNLKSTAYIIPVNIIPRNHSTVDLTSPTKGSTKSA